MSAALPDMTTCPRFRTTAVLRDPQCGDRVLLDEQDGDVRLGGQLLHQLEDLGHDERGQAQRRLVEQQALGPAHECAADGQLLPLAAAEGVGAHLAALPQHREEVVELRVQPGALVLAAPHAAEAEVLLHGQLGNGRAALGDQCDAHADDVLGLPAGDLHAVEGRGARHGLDEAGQGPHERRLAGAVGADHGRHLAARDLERDVGQRVHGSVVHGEAGDGEHQAAPSSPR